VRVRELRGEDVKKPLSILAAAVVLLLAVIARAVIATWLQGFFGFCNGCGNGSHYLFWSGSGSDLAYLSMGAGAISSTLILWHRVNCHEPGCWRIGRVHVDDKGTLSCFRHHPDGKPQPGHIRRAHKRHQAAKGG
jgi:hypothetical protein